MSESYQRRCLERDQLERVNERLRLQALVMANAIVDASAGAPQWWGELAPKALQVARQVTGMPDPKKGTQLRLKLHGKRAA